MINVAVSQLTVLSSCSSEQDCWIFFIFYFERDCWIFYIEVTGQSLPRRFRAMLIPLLLHYHYHYALLRTWG